MRTSAIKVTRQDLNAGYGKSPAKLAAEMLRDMNAYEPSGPRDQREAAIASFNLFADTWIRPKLRAIIAKERRRELKDNEEASV